MVNEILIGVLISGGFLLIGIIVTILGQIYSDKKEFERKIKYLREETFFKKKLEYFERLCKAIQDRLLIYIQLSASIQFNDPNLEERLKKVLDLKGDLINLIPGGAPLYFQQLKDLGFVNGKINEFVILEVDIFREIDKFSKEIKFKGKKIIFKEQPSELHKKILALGLKGEGLIEIMHSHIFK